MAKATTTPTTTPDNPMIAAFKAARRVSTPIVAIETPDSAATISTVRKVLSTQTPVLVWDCARGLRGMNPLGEAAMGALGVDPAITVNATETLLAMENLSDLSVVFLHNFHLQVTETPVKQALWNLRDVFKVNKRMAVLLGPGFQLPSELAGDVIVLDEPLPTRAELSVILDQQHKNADLALPDDATRRAALDAIVGLSAFTAEQVSAMALTKNGVDVPRLWDRKVKAIENRDGMRVWQGAKGDTTLDELRGIDNVVDFMRQLIKAEAFGAIVFIDEMDKALAGGMAEHTGDSGVGKDQVGTLLSYIEDTKSLGVLLAGVAGTGKTQLVKAVGAESGKPVIVFDLAGMKAGHVGESERAIRENLKVVTATAEGRVLFVGTANRTTLFTPELNRRFPDQFFYDSPDDAGRAAIWPVYVAKNGLTAAQAAIPAGFDKGWTGAEIKRACERAALFNTTVVEAAKFIIPAAVSHRQANDNLRREASGRFLSASKPGWYEAPAAAVKAAAATQRSIEVQ